MGVTLEEVYATKNDPPAGLGTLRPSQIPISEIYANESASRENVQTPPLEGPDAAPEDQPFLKRAGEFATSPKGARLATEIGLGLTGAGLLPRAGVAAYRALSASGALKLGKWGRLGLQMLGGGGGETAGSLVSETFDPTPEGESAVNRALTTGAFAAAGEGVGGAGYHAFRKLRTGGSRMIPGGREAVEDLAEHGLTPGLASDSWFVDFVQKGTEKAAAGGGTMRRSLRRVEEYSQKQLQNFADGLRGPVSKEFVGEVIGDAQEGGLLAFKEAAKIRYRGLDAMRDAAGLGGVDLSDVVPIAKEIADEAASGITNPAKAKIARNILDMVEPEKVVGTGIFDEAGNEITRIIPANNVVSWEKAGQVKSQLLRIARTGDEPIVGESVAAGKRLSPQIDRAMKYAAREAGGDIYKEWRSLSKWWGEGAEVFNSKLMRSIAVADPEAIYQIAIKANRPASIRRVRNMIINKDLPPAELALAEKSWEMVQGQFLFDIMADSSSDGLNINGARLVSKLEKVTDEALSELFPKGNWKQFKRLANNHRVLQSTVGRGVPGGMLIQLQQGGAFLLLLTGDLDPTTAGALFVAPEIASRLFTNKTVVKYLTIGRRAPPGSKVAREAFQRVSQVHAALMRQSQRDDKQKNHRVSTYRTALP